MMTAVLSVLIFVSIVWVVGAWHFIEMSLSGISFFDAGILNIILYGLFICIPLFLIWWMFSTACQSLYNRRTFVQMKTLFAQMKKNQEYSDLLARIMLGSEQDNRNAFEMSRFDLLLSDLNELLSDFISRQRMASEDQIEYLWTKVQNGGKWSFGKVIIENYNRQPNFRQKVLVNVLADNVLAGTVLEFCARYQKIIGLLEKYDKEKVFLDMLETGVMGKVFAIMAPISSEIQRARDGSYGQSQTIQPQPQPQTQPQHDLRQPEHDSPKARFDEKVNTADEETKKDSFSLALERSFGSEPSLETAENKKADDVPSFLSNPESLSETQKTLDALKKEWQTAGAAAEQKDKVDDLTYPFGGWADVQNYKK